MSNGAVLGIDVGFSERRKSSCLCRLDWSEGFIRLTFEKVGVDPADRRLALRRILREPTLLAAVAIDGPLTRGLRHSHDYRAAEALLSRGVFQKRGKPGQTSSPVGQKLHYHATQFANLTLAETRLGPSSLARSLHIEPICEASIVEAFPSQFLAALIDEDCLPRLQRDSSDRYWECLASTQFDGVLGILLPNHCLEARTESIKDHDERAAVVCALTALTVAMGRTVGVGDPENGDIFLPAAEIWGVDRGRQKPWMETALRNNVDNLRGGRNSEVTHYRNARVRLHGSYWFP